MHISICIFKMARLRMPVPLFYVNANIGAAGYNLKCPRVSFGARIKHARHILRGQAESDYPVPFKSAWHV